MVNEGGDDKFRAPKKLVHVTTESGGKVVRPTAWNRTPVQSQTVQEKHPATVQEKDEFLRRVRSWMGDFYVDIDSDSSLFLVDLTQFETLLKGAAHLVSHGDYVQLFGRLALEFTSVRINALTEGSRVILEIGQWNHRTKNWVDSGAVEKMPLLTATPEAFAVVVRKVASL